MNDTETIVTSTGKIISKYQMQGLEEGMRRKKRTKEFHFRTTEDQGELIKNSADRLGVTLVDFCTSAVVGQALAVTEQLNQQEQEEAKLTISAPCIKIRNSKIKMRVSCGLFS